MFEHPIHQIIQWRHTDVFHFAKATNGRKTELSLEDRMMRCLVFNKSGTVKLSEVLLGQKKSTIYENIWLLMQVLCKTTQSQFILPNKATSQHFSGVGAEILGDAFATAAYMKEGFKVESSNIFAAQLLFL